MDQGVSPAMENAFTRTGTERPIPANFGPSAQMPNAFHDGNSTVVAAPPTMPNQYTMYPQLQAGMDARSRHADGCSRRSTDVNQFAAIDGDPAGIALSDAA